MRATPKRSTAKFKLLYAILADANLSAASKVVATSLLLKFQNNKSGRCDPSFATIAKTVGRQRRTIFSSIEELKARQWLEVTGTKGGGRGNTNQFTIRAPVKAKRTGDADDTPTGAADDTGTGAADFTSAVYGTKGCSPLHTNLLEPLASSKRVCVGSASNDAPIPQRAPDGALEKKFEELCHIWRDKPHGVGCKKTALKVFQAVCAEHDPDDILASAHRWVAVTEPQYLQALEKWLEHGAWRKEPPPVKKRSAGRGGKINPVDEMLNAGGIRRNQ